MSHNPSHIIVTPKGLELQVQLLKEVTAPNFPQIKSPQAFENPRKNRQHHISTSVSTSLSPFPKPRAGYFGPKEPTISIADPAQDYLFYPNYLQQSPQESVSRHFCVWKPTSTTKHGKTIEPVIPKGRYVHHSLFNYAVDLKVGEDPSIESLNRLTFGGAGNVDNGGLNTAQTKTPAMSRKNLDATEIRESMILDRSMHKTQSQTFYNNKSILNNSSSQFRTTGTWSRHRGTTTTDWAIKEEKFIEKHQTQQKEYQRMLKRFAEEKARTRLKHEENQNEPPEFMKKMKSAEKDIKQLQGKKFNEDSRFVKRLREFQTQKYEKTWQTHEWAQMNSTAMGEKFISTKKKGVRGGPLYNVSAVAGDPSDTDKSINSTKIKTEEQKEDAVRMLKSASSKILRKGESQLQKAITPRDEKKFLDFIKM